MSETDATETTDVPANSLTPEEKNWAMACHLAALALFIVPFLGSILGPLTVWLLKRTESEFIDTNGKEALNFQITMAIVFFVCGLSVLVLIGFVLLPIAGVFWLVFVIIAAVKTSEGEAYKYPVCLRLIK